jgi:hypothetical protein
MRRNEPIWNKHKLIIMSKVAKNKLVPEISISSDYDWIDEDEVINDQKFVVVSFCEPEIETLSKKETFVFSEFIKECLREDATAEKYRVNFSKVTPEKLVQLYNDFKTENDDYLAEELKRVYPDVVFERALKIRGAYKSQNKAQDRINFLKKYDRIHNIYMCEVGKWVPYNPPAAAIENHETSNVHLNRMLAEKRKNQTEAKEFYERERQERIKQCAEVADERNKKIRDNDFDAIIAEHCEQEILGLVDEEFSKEPESRAVAAASSTPALEAPAESITMRANAPAATTVTSAPSNGVTNNSTHQHLTISDFENADFDEELAESIVKKLKLNGN